MAGRRPAERTRGSSGSWSTQPGMRAAVPGVRIRKHPCVAVIAQVPAQRLVAERFGEAFGTRVGVHVDQAGQQSAAVDDELRARDRIGSPAFPIDPEGPLLPLWQNDAPHLQRHRAAPSHRARPNAGSGDAADVLCQTSLLRIA